MNCSTPGFLSITKPGNFLKLMSIESVMQFNHLILCHPLTHLEPEILHCEVKWTLENTTIKANGGDEFPAVIFQILKEDSVKVLHSICQQIWKTQQWLQDWKRPVFIPVSKKGNVKDCSIQSAKTRPRADCGSDHNLLISKFRLWKK